VLAHLPLPIPQSLDLPRVLRPDDRPQQQRTKTADENMRRNKKNYIYILKIPDFSRSRFRSVWRQTTDFELCRRPLQSSLWQEGFAEINAQHFCTDSFCLSLSLSLSLVSSFPFALFRVLGERGGREGESGSRPGGSNFNVLIVLSSRSHVHDAFILCNLCSRVFLFFLFFGVGSRYLFFVG